MPPAEGSASILLVDDNADGLAARRWVLEELGYSVVTACSGANALEEIGKRRRRI